MKTLIFLIVTLCGSHGVFAESASEKAEAWYQKGLAAEKSGDPATAIAAYKTALKFHAGHAKARFQLGEVKINAGSIKADAAEAKIGGIMIPAYQIEDATIQEALGLLAAMIEKQSKEEITPNFVVEDPGKKLTDAKITMNLKNVPVSAILKYIHAQTQTKIRYDEHAVVILAR
jgi:hypothetical protein